MFKRIIIFTGGTGGHVIPALNLGNYLINAGFECCLITDKRGLVYLTNFNGRIYVINSSHFSGNLYFKFKSIINLIIGTFQSVIIIIKNRPNRCIAFGSYATFIPLIITMIFKPILKTKLYIHEQNSIIGKVNLLFLPLAQYIFTNFDYIKNLKPHYHKKKIFCGLPSDINLSLDIEAIKNVNKKIIVFLYGGSQGSKSLIDKFILILKNLKPNELKKIKLIIQSPKNLFNGYKKILNLLNVEFEIKFFYKDIDSILSIADIAITRGGAGTINDIIKNKIPSIIIPLPNAINNHQFYNAKFLFDIKGAIFMDENEFNVTDSTNIFKNLLFDPILQKKIKDKLSQIHLKDANNIILEKILL